MIMTMGHDNVLMQFCFCLYLSYHVLIGGVVNILRTTKYTSADRINAADHRQRDPQIFFHIRKRKNMLFDAKVPAMYPITHKRMMAGQYNYFISVFTDHLRKAQHKFTDRFAGTIPFNTRFLVWMQKPLTVKYNKYSIFIDRNFYRSGAAFRRK